MKATLRSALLITLCFGLAGYTQADEPPRPECIAPASPGGGFDLTCKL
ncbi:MAG TPA: tricarboxylic transporter, partial [Pseudomonas sp.]|nr:tricarboxylic transporter [Pseudomonas sp.]